MRTPEQRLGELGERLAAEYVQKKGMRILEHNYRIRGGEIDLIAQDGREVVFIEVKTRASREFGRGVEAVDALLNRGGLLSMMKTVALAIVALSFAGVFECTGMASSILKKVVSHVKTERGLVIATILTAWGILLGTGQQYVAIIMAGRLFRPLYQEYNLKPQNLSRALEDAGTVFGGIVPYSTGAGFTEGMLGVSAWQYGPFTYFGWINPLVAILIAALGKSRPEGKGQNLRSAALLQFCRV